MSERIRLIGSDSEADRLLKKHLINDYREAYVEIDEENYCMPIYYVNEESCIRNFEVRDEDIYIAAHPKTGTTWCQEMVWLLMNNFDYEGAKVPLPTRFPVMEVLAIIDFNKTEYKHIGGGDYYTNFLNKLKSPRFLKTHLPWSLLPEQIQNGTKKPKIISLVRNAQDLCISYYNYCRTFEGYTGGLEEFCNIFMAGRAIYGPYWKNVLSYWNQRNRPNVLIINYRDMIKDLAEVVRIVAEFLGVTYSGEQLQGLLEHLSFENMKNNGAVNHSNHLEFVKGLNLTVEEIPFMRSGKEGAYKTVMNQEMIEKFKVWTQKSLAGVDLIID